MTPGTAPATAIDLARCRKIVLRRERKGRGGKTATIIEGLGLPPKTLELLLRTLRKTLGCGGTIDGDRLVLNGDLPERADAWLRAHGAPRTVIGN
jgi:translation initiation factor 1